MAIDADGLPSLTLGNSDSLRVAEWVLEIGSPFSLNYSVSQVIVRLSGRSISSFSL